MLDVRATEDGCACRVGDCPLSVLVSVPSIASDTSGWSLWECIAIDTPGAKVTRRIRSMCPGQLSPASTVPSNRRSTPVGPAGPATPNPVRTRSSLNPIPSTCSTYGISSVSVHELAFSDDHHPYRYGSDSRDHPRRHRMTEVSASRERICHGQKYCLSPAMSVDVLRQVWRGCPRTPPVPKTKRPHIL